MVAERVAEVEASANAELQAAMETMQLRLSDAQQKSRTAALALAELKAENVELALSRGPGGEKSAAEIEALAEKKWKGALRASVRKYRSQIKEMQTELESYEAAAASAPAKEDVDELIKATRLKARAVREAALDKQEARLQRAAKKANDAASASQKDLEARLQAATKQLAARVSKRSAAGAASSPALNRRRSVDRAIVEHEKALRSVKAESEAALEELRVQLRKDVAKAEHRTRREMAKKAKRIEAGALAEAGPPRELAADPSSRFAALLQAKDRDGQ